MFYVPQTGNVLLEGVYGAFWEGPRVDSELLFRKEAGQVGRHQVRTLPAARGGSTRAVMVRPQAVYIYTKLVCEDKLSRLP